ncbi:MAG: leader peptidase (prepilin peptidase) / N-methyltransferase [Streptosporangiaceae bacterium]|nr:peptidase prepilin type [Streptosporangiaceae bacterium]MDX6431943.1 leader peptidase (prepilin peptidase) / N-methyltransferase [Streptosporangiaceae bacterium]
MSEPIPRDALPARARYDWTGPVTGRPVPVALVTVAVLAVLGWRIGPRPDLPAFGYLGVVGVLLAFIDVALTRLPDPLTLPSYVAGAALLGLAAPFTGQGGTRYVHALIGMAVLWFLYALQWVIVPTQIGLGDVKLSGVLGLYLGWLGLNAWIVGVLGMFLFGGLFSVVLLVSGKATRKSSIPFGPFMLAGTFAAVFLFAQPV